MIPTWKKCRGCGRDFTVGCMDGKQKRCRECRLEAEVERARGLLLESERARQTDDEIKAEYLAAAVALVERAERAEAEVGRLREAAEHVARVMPHGCYMSLPDGTVVEHDANSRCPGCAMRRLRAALADPAGGDE